MNSFITNNKENNLKKRLVELISKSEELKFLVGFFYFSGITELYSSLKEKNGNIKLRILVGLEVDNLISGMTVECINAKEKKGLSIRDIENNFINSVRKSLNSDDFDRQEFYEQIDFFIDLIIKDKLIIRKTKKPNHAKLYIFEFEDKIIQKNLFITGSSNLTKAGLSHQDEFNVEIKDYGTEEASEYFENLWKDSIEITENKALKDRLIKTIEEETQVKKITPFEAFVVILKTYLDIKSTKESDLTLKEIVEKAGYKHYQYQEDAVKQAVKILNSDNGVIVADVVGLGKSIIASLIAKVSREKRGLILCPPGLISEWENYMSNFGLSSWKVLSSGNIDFAKEFVEKEKVDPIEIVIIDEAHRFRNSDTTNYEKLKNICRNKKVVLLSATPFNNSPADILSLLELFIIPKKSSLALDGDLKNLFKNFKGEFEKLLEIRKFYKHSDTNKVERAERNYRLLFNEDKIDIEKVKIKTKELAAKIRSVIEPIVVRRNRLDLQKNSRYKDEVKNLSVIELPKTWFYELTKEQSKFYDEILSDYFGEKGKFTGAIYNPFAYESGKTENEKKTLEENRQFYAQKNTTTFMKRTLVKRLESSFGSFEESIENQISITKTILKFIEKNQKYILDRKLLEKMTEIDEDEVEEALKDFAMKLEENNFPKNNKIYDLNNFKERDEFIGNIKFDLEMYQEIQKKLLALKMVKNDPKSKKIIEKITEHLAKKPEKGEPKRKVIIFTEYRDTANFLIKTINKKFKDRMLYSGDLGKEKIKEINRNFDAAYKGKQENKYDVLLATDKISEGFNLNRAGMVINYDIPWNPVRVIQRVGRINRISKKVFEKLQIVNFFPTEKGAELVQTEKIAASKMLMIHNILGEDAKIFHSNEEPTPAALFDKFKQDPDDEEESFETKIINKFEEINKKYPELIKEVGNYPSKIKVAKGFKEQSLLVFTKRQRLHIQEVTKEGKEKIIKEVSFESIYEKIYCDNPNLEGLELSDNFWDFYEKAKNFEERTFSTGSQQSVEVQTKNFLNGIIREIATDISLREIAEIFLEDLNDYGTLTLPTMRKIVSVEKIKDGESRLREFKNIIKDIGGINYLNKVKESIKDTRKEIIIAMENQ